MRRVSRRHSHGFPHISEPKFTMLRPGFLRDLMPSFVIAGKPCRPFPILLFDLVLGNCAAEFKRACVFRLAPL
jgi:hypothetical protein